MSITPRLYQTAKRAASSKLGVIIYMVTYSEMTRLLPWLAVAACTLLFSACPRQEAAPERTVLQERTEPAPKPQRPSAHFLFVVPPPDPLYPEREHFTSEFSAAAKKVFPAAGWDYRELRLYEHPMNEWHAIMREELDSYPMIVFSYHKSYMSLFCELAEHIEVRCVSYMLALTPVKPDASSLINVLEFRTEELGYIAGATLAGVTVSGHLATICLDDASGQRFTAGFYQGMTEQRSGATLSEIVVSRSDLADQQDGIKLLATRLEEENRRLSSGMSIDSVGSFAGPLTEPFILSLPGRSINATCGPVPNYDIQTGVLLTSTYIDFGRLPQYLVENADDLRLLKPVRKTSSADQSESQFRMQAGGTLGSRGPQYISLGLAEGLLNYSGFSHAKRFRTLPEGLATDVDYYYRAICAGEIEVSDELPK